MRLWRDNDKDRLGEVDAIHHDPSIWLRRAIVRGVHGRGQSPLSRGMRGGGKSRDREETR